MLTIRLFPLILLTLALEGSAQPPGPPPSAGHSLVYATHLGMVIMVNAGLGGAEKPPASTRTKVWGWSGTEWKLLDASGPPLRNLSGVAYDSSRRVLVMHGGTYDAGQVYGDTWEWGANGWRKLTGVGPGPRDHTQMAYDAKRRRMVLFGGSADDPNVAFADTWELDGSGWVRAATVGPSPLVHHAMQFDQAAGRVVLFGGMTPGSNTTGATWEWDGSTWLPAPRGPSISHARMAFDQNLGSLISVGAMPAAADLGFVRRAGSWSRLPAAPGPWGRYLTDAAFDESRKVLVLFGGGMSGRSTMLGDTWEFDGTSWQQRAGLFAPGA